MIAGQLREGNATPLFVAVSTLSDLC